MMEILWAPNPLATTVVLSETEKEIFKLKCKLVEREERLIGVHFALKEWDYFDLQRAREEASIFGDDGNVDRDDDGGYSWMIRELESGYHVGDCTCVACSCGKCHAESILGIDTIAGLGKHPANKIDGAFRTYKTLEEVIAHLRNYDPKQPPPESKAAWDRVGGYEKHIPRWKAEAKAAYEWLTAYRDMHFKEGEENGN